MTRVRRTIGRFIERLGAPALLVIGAATALCAFGLAMTASVGSTDDTLANVAGNQAVRLLIAVPVVLAVCCLRPRWIRANAYLLYAVSVVGLVAVLAFGRAVNNSRRWIDLGGGFKFQPSDLAKLALSLALARFLAARSRATSALGIATALALTGVPALLILKEPDLGTALVLVPVAAAALFAAGARRRHLAGAVAALAVAATLYLSFGAHRYQMQRIETWLGQGSMSQSEKLAEGFHLLHSKIAIGSGGLLGFGLGQGPQNVQDLLPERHTDFVFAVIGEELGFVGAITVLLLEVAIPVGLLLSSLRVREPFARLAVIAIAAQIGAQALVNVGVVTGCLPTTGIALPLVSYGGTSAMITLVSIAVALTLAAQAEPVFAGDSFDPGEEATLLEGRRRGNRRRRRASDRAAEGTFSS